MTGMHANQMQYMSTLKNEHMITVNDSCMLEVANEQITEENDKRMWGRMGVFLLLISSLHGTAQCGAVQDTHL